MFISFYEHEMDISGNSFEPGHMFPHLLVFMK